MDYIFVKVSAIPYHFGGLLRRAGLHLVYYSYPIAQGMVGLAVAALLVWLGMHLHFK